MHEVFQDLEAQLSLLPEQASMGPLPGDLGGKQHSATSGHTAGWRRPGRTACSKAVTYIMVLTLGESYRAV